LALARKAVEEGADAIWLSDDHAGLDSPFISPQMMYDLDFQFQKKIVDAVHKMGKPCIMHSCGNLGKTIEGMIGTGVDGIMAIQPLAKNDIYALKKQYGGRIAFIGNICISELMPKGTAAEVDREVKKLITHVARDGGFILSTCNALLDDQPLANIVTMHLAGEKYGRMHSA
jgi:uroporphyrinogen decarboxylase